MQIDHKEQFVSEEAIRKHLQYCETQFHKEQQEVKTRMKYVFKPTPRQCCQQYYCNNIGCLIIFIIFLGGFIGFSIYTIDESLKSDTYKNEWESTTKIYWICAGFLSFTVVFAFVFMICTCISSKRSQDLISVGAMFTNLLLLSVAYILYSQKDEQIRTGSLPFFVLAVLYSIIVCFYYKDISRSTIMLQTISYYMQRAASINKTAIFLLAYSSILAYLWSWGFISSKYLQDKIRQDKNSHQSKQLQNSDDQNISYPGLSLLWAIFYIFIFLHTHYLSTYLSATSFGYWYYHYPEKIVQEVQSQQSEALIENQSSLKEESENKAEKRPISQIMEPGEDQQPKYKKIPKTKEDFNVRQKNMAKNKKNQLFEARQTQSENPFSSSFKFMCMGLGTISFATFINPVMIIVKLLYSLAKLSKKQCCFGCLNIILNCLNSCSEAEIRTYTFNDYTIIVSALTGQSYVKSSEIQAHCSNITDKNPKEEQKLNNELSESQRLRDKQIKYEKSKQQYLNKSLYGFKSVETAILLFRFVVISFVGSIITLFMVMVILFEELKEFEISQDIPFLAIGPLGIFFASAIITNSFFQCYINSISTFYMIFRLDTKITFYEDSKVTWWKQYTKVCKYNFDNTFSGTVPEVPLIKYTQFKNPQDQEAKEGIKSSQNPSTQNQGIQNQKSSKNKQQSQNSDKKEKKEQENQQQGTIQMLKQKQDEIVEE